MNISESSIRLKEMIEKAIEDQQLTREEYEKIMDIATEDGVIDRFERALLQQLQEMLADKSVKIVAK